MTIDELESSVVENVMGNIEPNQQKKIFGMETNQLSIEMSPEDLFQTRMDIDVKFVE
jgi:hypothetical protein